MDEGPESPGFREVAGARFVSRSIATPMTTTLCPTPVGTAIAVAPGQAAVGHSSEPDDVVVFALDGDGPRVAHEGASTSV